MKLIDLLKQELPKRGGWPDGHTHARQDGDMEICFSGGNITTHDFRVDYMADDVILNGGTGESSAVTREQYEAATWIPPVGTECEYQDYKGDWHKIFIIARYGDGTFIEWRSSGIYTGCDLIRGEVSPDKFRPIRTEREKGIEAMLDLLNAGTQLSLADAIEQLYDAGYRKV